MVESSVWPPWRADCHPWELQLSDGVGGDRCWHRWPLPLLVRVIDHLDGKSKASHHDRHPDSFCCFGFGCGNVHQAMDCWALQKVADHFGRHQQTISHSTRMLCFWKRVHVGQALKLYWIGGQQLRSQYRKSWCVWCINLVTLIEHSKAGLDTNKLWIRIYSRR